VKIRRRALLEAVKQKLQAGNLVVIEDIKLAEPKTKLIAQALSPVREKKASLLLVSGENSSDLVRASRNIYALNLVTQSDLNAYDVWRRQKLVLFKSACDALIARYV
jgi:large subunit ribosomal protein L4